MKLTIRCSLLITLFAGLLVYLPPSSAATIIITDLEDVEFGDLPPTSALVTQRIRICVNSTPPGPYRLTALGLTTTGAFELVNEAPQTITYVVHASTRRNGLGAPLVAGVPRTGFNSRQSNAGGRCLPPWLWITVMVTEQELQQAPGGRYWGTLQITVAPE
ncbi:MAG: hypothetical protein ACI9UU_001987 [Candidatus Azotimanducaceae bacterium]|jgi:hypothetical protein